MDLQDWKIKDDHEKEIGSFLKLKDKYEYLRMKKSCKSLNQENHDADNLLGEMLINAMLHILLSVF